MTRHLPALRDERGFTLVELMFTVFLGTILILAAYAVLDGASRSAWDTQDRQDAVQRGRLAMEVVVGQVRSAGCLSTSQPPIIAGSDGSVLSFTTDMTDPMVYTDALPQKRILTFDSTASSLTERDYPGQGSLSNLTFSSTPSRTRILLQNGSAQSSPTTPVFGYFGWNGTTPPTPSLPLSTPLTAADAERVARITVTFVAKPSRSPKNSRGASTFINDVFLRGSDPGNPNSTDPC